MYWQQQNEKQYMTVKGMRVNRLGPLLLTQIRKKQYQDSDMDKKSPPRKTVKSDYYHMP